MRHLLITLALTGASATAVTPLPAPAAALKSEPLFQGYRTIMRTQIDTGERGSINEVLTQDSTGDRLTLISNPTGRLTVSATFVTSNLTTALAFTGLTTDNSSLLRGAQQKLNTTGGILRTPRFTLKLSRAEQKYTVTVTALVHPAEHFSRDAPVTQKGKAGQGSVVIFTDYACPYCQTLARETLPYWKARYPNVTIRSQAAPNDTAHPGALRAARYALCVSRTKPTVSADFETLLYTNRSWQGAGDQAFLKLVALARAPEQAVRTCVADPASNRALNRMTAQSRALGVTGTPTVYVNGVAMQRWNDQREFDALLKLRH